MHSFSSSTFILLPYHLLFHVFLSPCVMLSFKFCILQLQKPLTSESIPPNARCLHGSPSHHLARRPMHKESMRMKHPPSLSVARTWVPRQMDEAPHTLIGTNSRVAFRMPSQYQGDWCPDWKSKYGKESWRRAVWSPSGPCYSVEWHLRKG